MSPNPSSYGKLADSSEPQVMPNEQKEQ